MGVMSRRVLPVCGSICIFCPSLRARSRQPVKRYKKLLAEIFPKNQEIEPNDRKIGKLCEYVSKNPLRVPKITEYLEQRFYKDLRNENVGSVKVVLCVYRKFISSCKEQMPLFSCSLLDLIRTLLDQTSKEDLQILGCNALVDFVNVQVGSTYMFNIEGLVLKLCQLAQEVGDDDRALSLRAAGMQALSSVVRFMGQQSHIPMEFDKIISATLDNFVDISNKHMNGKLDRIMCSSDRCSRVSTNTDDSEPSSANSQKDAPSLMDFRDIKQQLELPLDAAKNPSYWSKVCLYNMAGLAKETTTIRRVLEPFFHNFDSEEYWSPERGLACSVLMYMQLLLEDAAAENSHLLISILVKHLDHKQVAKQPLKQISIIHVIRQLVQYVKQQASSVLLGALTDMLKHLRKCMQYSEEAPNSGSGEEKLNADLQSALEICISQLSSKIGDAGPILDMMAVVLENVPNNNIVARSTIFSVYRTAQIISSLPNVSYNKKTFPDALFHQLLMAMGHPDRETRTGAHRIFSTVLMPTLICPWSDQKKLASLNCLGSSANSALKGSSGRFSNPEKREEKVYPIGTRKDSQRWNDVKQSQILQSHSKSYSFKSSLTNGIKELATLRLSSQQVSLLLSSIWVQATSRENTPSSFEAMAHTYNIALLLTRTKNSSHMALVRCFQLAFSLRSISLDQEGALQPSRRRSLFTMASCMLIFSARAGNLPELIPIVKSSLTDKTVDPYLELVDNISLHAVNENPAGDIRFYGSEEDDFAALKSLSVVESDEQQLKQTVISHLLSKLEKLSEDELSGIKDQLSQGFSPDESYPLGTPLFMETPQSCSPQVQLDFQSFDEMVDTTLFDESIPDTSQSQSGRKTSNSSNSLDILNVNQLLESVLETAQQVSSLPTSTTPTSYDQVKDQCEALVTGKQQKMSALQSFKQQLGTKAIILINDTEMKRPAIMDKPTKEFESSPDSLGKEMVQRHDQLFPCSLEYGYQSFRLPPASPYDKFLKAAGC